MTRSLFVGEEILLRRHLINDAHHANFKQRHISDLACNYKVGGRSQPASGFMTGGQFVPIHMSMYYRELFFVWSIEPSSNGRRLVGATLPY